MPRDWIAGKDLYQRESDRVFARHWLYVGRESDLDSTERRPLVVDGHRLFLMRDRQGVVRCFRNFCRHRGSELVTSHNCADAGDRIQCPYHAWSYARDGALVSAPNMHDVQDFDPQEYSLLEVECADWHGCLFVRMSSDGPPLGQFLGPLAEHARSWTLTDLRTAQTLQYRVAANWKLLFQNYSECYHCPTVHPALNRITPYKGASNDLTAGPILGGPMSLSEDSQTMSSSGAFVGRLLPGLNEDQRRSVSYYTVFPSLFISAHPDFVLLHRLKRIHWDVTEVDCEFLFGADAISDAAFDASPAVEFWDLTNRQDWNVCEASQRGMSDRGYVPGKYSNLESVLVAFDDHYRREMQLD